VGETPSVVKEDEEEEGGAVVSSSILKKVEDEDEGVDDDADEVEEEGDEAEGGFRLLLFLGVPLGFELDFGDGRGLLVDTEAFVSEVGTAGFGEVAAVAATADGEEAGFLLLGLGRVRLLAEGGDTTTGVSPCADDDDDDDGFPPPTPRTPLGVTWAFFLFTLLLLLLPLLCPLCPPMENTSPTSLSLPPSKSSPSSSSSNSSKFNPAKAGVKAEASFLALLVMLCEGDDDEHPPPPAPLPDLEAGFGRIFLGSGLSLPWVFGATTGGSESMSSPSCSMLASGAGG
jgi:hypothetical protein